MSGLALGYGLGALVVAAWWWRHTHAVLATLVAGVLWPVVVGVVAGLCLMTRDVRRVLRAMQEDQ